MKNLINFCVHTMHFYKLMFINIPINSLINSVKLILNVLWHKLPEDCVGTPKYVGAILILIFVLLISTVFFWYINKH